MAHAYDVCILEAISKQQCQALGYSYWLIVDTNVSVDCKHRVTMTIRCHRVRFADVSQKPLHKNEQYILYIVDFYLGITSFFKWQISSSFQKVRQSIYPDSSI